MLNLFTYAKSFLHWYLNLHSHCDEDYPENRWHHDGILSHTIKEKIEHYDEVMLGQGQLTHQDLIQVL